MTRGSPTSYDGEEDRGGEKERVREKTGAARTKARKKDPVEMPVKRREIVVKGRGEEEERRRGEGRSCPASRNDRYRSRTDADGW